MKILLKFLVFFLYISKLSKITGGVSYLDEYESYSSCSADEQVSDLMGLDQYYWMSEVSEQNTLIPYSKLFYKYIFEPIFNNEQSSSEKKKKSFFGLFLNKITFAIILFIWSCILFIACGTVADTYISSLMIKLAECMNLSDTFAGSTLLAFSNAASDVILGIISVSIGEKDAIDVFLGDVVGACLFIILVVFGCVMVFSKSNENKNYINIPVFNHLRDTIALTIGLIQLLLINHLGYITSKVSIIPLIAYGIYVLLLQWSERSTSCSMPVNLTIREEYVGSVYEHIIDSGEVKANKLSFRNNNINEFHNYLSKNAHSVPPIPFTPPDSIKDMTNQDSMTPDLEIPPIKLSFSNNSFSLEENNHLIDKNGLINRDLYWDRIGSKSRSIKKTLLLLTPTHSPSPSLTNDEFGGKVLTPTSSKFNNEGISENISSSSIQIPDKETDQDSSQDESLKNLISTKNKMGAIREKNFNNTLELPNPWQNQRSKSPISFSNNLRQQTYDNHLNTPPLLYMNDAQYSMSNSSSNIPLLPNIDNNRSSSNSQLVLVNDDYAVRLSRNLSMSEVVYQTESLYNSLLPPPANEENILKIQRRGRMRIREDRCRYKIENMPIEYQLKIPQNEKNYNFDFEILMENFFNISGFIRQLLMTPIMFLLYLTVPSPSLRRSIQIMQPLFIVLAVGFEKQIYKRYPLYYLLMLLFASIISLLLFIIYTCIIPNNNNDDDTINNLRNDLDNNIKENVSRERSNSLSNIKLPEIKFSSKTKKLLTNSLMYCDMFCGIIMSIYWNGVLVNELVECIRVIGLTLGIKPAILGLTIVAMGNSIADLFANVAVSRAGHAHMGLAGCYGACVFLLLFGFGCSVFVRAIQLGFSKDIHLHFESQIITATYQLLYFLPFSALIVVLSKGRVHRIWGLIFILYFVIGMAFILQGTL